MASRKQLARPRGKPGYHDPAKRRLLTVLAKLSPNEAMTSDEFARVVDLDERFRLSFRNALIAEGVIETGPDRSKSGAFFARITRKGRLFIAGALG